MSTLDVNSKRDDSLLNLYNFNNNQPQVEEINDDDDMMLLSSRKNNTPSPDNIKYESGLVEQDISSSRKGRKARLQRTKTGKIQQCLTFLSHYKDFTFSISVAFLCLLKSNDRHLFMPGVKTSLSTLMHSIQPQSENKTCVSCSGDKFD